MLYFILHKILFLSPYPLKYYLISVIAFIYVLKVFYIPSTQSMQVYTKIKSISYYHMLLLLLFIFYYYLIDLG